MEGVIGTGIVLLFFSLLSFLPVHLSSALLLLLCAFFTFPRLCRPLPPSTPSFLPIEPVDSSTLFSRRSPSYTLQTPLMRNQEATNQVCVNCEINPPVDPEEEESQHLSPLPQEHQPKSDSQQLETKKPNSGPIMSLPPPTSALPAIPSPGPLRPMPSPNNRVSVLDPMMDAVRMNYRTPAGRDSSVLLPSDYPRPPPPPGSTTPLPQPTRTPPPNKRLPGLPTPRLTFPRPPPGPPSLAASCLISPPSSPPAPKLMPRDKRRSPQSSVVVQGNNILLSATPPTRPRAPSRSNLPTPPPSMALDTAPGPNTIDVMIAEQTTHESTEMEERGSDVDDARSRNTGLENRPQAQKEAQMIEEDDEEKGLESHDEFEDAEEEYRPSEEEIRVRESRREQSERASRLIGEKMLQGWTMLQDPCPNSACNGVPLIRNRERKKEYCVICETTFQREQDLEQGVSLVPWVCHLPSITLHHFLPLLRPCLLLSIV
ncbi:hypothetical protein BC939DRAFT_278860 [Gamsiella multidivaricata]|uniref:uncharacterized protein n=1 Tax=Gamsiella multidivaricata TaxID=101098 RepID=UPI0022202C6C|nr:uncharacterized protein BC939DRAFT_278860 [Gamsiella multidivaricata]KAI7818821.1 hypothetical protein BC939DRAFT_278860 [Gamsiella multidivaricata]